MVFFIHYFMDSHHIIYFDIMQEIILRKVKFNYLFRNIASCKKWYIGSNGTRFAKAAGEFKATLMLGEYPRKITTMSTSISITFQADNNELAQKFVLIPILISILIIFLTGLSTGKVEA
jgi:ABC-type sulfate transport system permease component